VFCFGKPRLFSGVTKKAIFQQLWPAVSLNVHKLFAGSF
jgi:hypothetical protein